MRDAVLRCPDEGVCHHSCSETCWRVDNAAPLSGVFAEDEWALKQIGNRPLDPDETVIAFSWDGSPGHRTYSRVRWHRKGDAWVNSERIEVTPPPDASNPVTFNVETDAISRGD